VLWYGSVVLLWGRVEGSFVTSSSKQLFTFAESMRWICAQLDQLHRLVPELASTILILPFPPDFLPVGRRFGLDEIVDLGVAQFVDQLAGVSFVVVQIWQIVLAVDQLLFVMFYHGAFSHVALCQGTGKEKTEGRLE
jgi:hypothetical protein